MAPGFYPDLFFFFFFEITFCLLKLLFAGRPPPPSIVLYYCRRKMTLSLDLVKYSFNKDAVLLLTCADLALNLRFIYMYSMIGALVFVLLMQ